MNSHIHRARALQHMIDQEQDPLARSALITDAIDNFGKRVREASDSELVELIRSAPAMLDGRSSGDETLAHILAFHGKDDLIRALRAQLALDCRDKDRRTPLHLAAWNGQSTTVGLLLQLGVDAAAQDKYGATALHIAAFRGQWSCAQVLAAHAPELIERQTSAGESVLHLAVESGDGQYVEWAGRLSQQPNIKDKCGRTPLHTAAQKGNAHAVNVLISRGCDPNAEDNYKDTPLHYASESGSLPCVVLLLTHSANPNAADKYGLTPTHLAAANGHRACVQRLAEYGAELNNRNSDGETALHMAAAGGHHLVVELLLDLSADASVKNDEGRTAFDVASGESIAEVQRLLRRAANR